MAALVFAAYCRNFAVAAVVVLPLRSSDLDYYSVGLVGLAAAEK